jgi:cysteine desulfurase/selenocysteine lyase
LGAAVDWAAIRSEFPALERWTYLNTATFGQMPKRSVEAVARHFARRDETACADFLSWFDDVDQLRASLARLIHGQPDDIAFVPNTATAVSQLITGLEWRPGDRVVTLQDEFPDNLYISALLARRGVEFVEARRNEIYWALTSRTRLVVLSSVNYADGFRPPLEEIAPRVHELGALLYVDGTQSLGALQFDVNAAQPDMFSVHGYKWLLSPNGAGFMYVRPSLRERLEPQVVGWRSHRGWRDVSDLHHGVPEFVSSAEKYEGGIPAVPGLYGMHASVEMMHQIGLAAIERRAMRLAGLVRTALRGLGARLPSDESPHFDSPIVAARLEGRPAPEVAAELKRRGVLISARHGNLRVSTHFYNNENDVDRLAEELKRILA